MCKYNDMEPERSKSFSFHLGKRSKMKKTINSRYSLVVTHPTTNLPAHGLSTAERTGSPVFHVLWSIAEEKALNAFIYLCNLKKNRSFSNLRRPHVSQKSTVTMKGSPLGGQADANPNPSCNAVTKRVLE